MPLAHTPRAPMAVASLRKMGMSGGLGAQSPFARMRPLAISRLAGLADFAVGHWSHPIAFVRPWHQTARIDPWFGRAAHFDFRARRRQLESAAEALPAGRAAVQRAATTALESDSALWPESPAEMAWDVEPELFETLSEEPVSALAPIAESFVPVAIPQAQAVARGAPQRTSPPAVARAMVARRTSPQGRPEIEAEQSKTRPTAEGAQPARHVARGELLVGPGAANLQATPAEGTSGPSTAGILPTATVGASVSQARVLGEAQRPIWPPEWPFVFVTRAMAAASSVVRGVQAAGSALAASAPLVVRRASLLATPQAGARVRSEPGTTERPRTIADGISAAHPVSTMIAKVPPGELLLEAERMPDVALPGLDAPTGPAERVLRAQRPDQSIESDEPEAGATDARHESTRASETERHPEEISRLASDWPVLAAVQRLVKPFSSRAASPESAAMQVMRRLSPARRREAVAGVSMLPSLGAGEALPADVRRPMQTLLGRDLSAVLTFTSPVAATLGAEAFTSGERIVFAPGRLDMRSTRGLALLGHELAHVGQTLAFREEGGQSATDVAEDTARQQEAQVTRIIEQGWPQAPRMEVLDAARALGRLAGQSTAQAVSGPSPVAEAAPTAQAGGTAAGVSQAASGAAVAGPASAGGSAPAETGSGAGGGTAGGAGGGGGVPGGGPAAPNIEKLAQDVYGLLKTRLRAEQMRHQVY